MAAFVHRRTKLYHRYLFGYSVLFFFFFFGISTDCIHWIRAVNINLFEKFLV